MEDILIKKNRHSPSNVFRFKPLIYINKNTYKFKWQVLFTDKSYFEFDNTDLYDYSKLFGISFGHHQTNESYRFGFRMLDDKTINISLYYYINGVLYIEDILDIVYYKKYTFYIDYNKSQEKLFFDIKNENGHIIYSEIKNIKNPKCWGYRLNTYIGGNKSAPNDIIIKIKYN